MFFTQHTIISIEFSRSIKSRRSKCYYKPSVLAMVEVARRVPQTKKKLSASFSCLMIESCYVTWYFQTNCSYAIIFTHFFSIVECCCRQRGCDDSTEISRYSFDNVRKLIHIKSILHTAQPFPTLCFVWFLSRTVKILDEKCIAFFSVSLSLSPNGKLLVMAFL